MILDPILAVDLVEILRAHEHACKARDALDAIRRQSSLQASPLTVETQRVREELETLVVTASLEEQRRENEKDDHP
jgi:hypothetical protein